MARIKKRPQKTPIGASGSANPGGKKPQGNASTIRRKKKPKSGMAALKEIVRHQRSTKLLMRKTSFAQVAREIAMEHTADTGFQPSALAALQEAAEAFIIAFLESSNLLAMHAKRVTLQQKDLVLLRQILVSSYGIFDTR